MTRAHRRVVACAVTTAVATLAAAVLTSATALAAIGTGIPRPEVTGPIPVTASSHPFGAADHTLVPEDLRRVGYVEDEFFVSGKANVYEWPAPGPAVVRTPDAPYTTRILVRRPAKASRFSGKVIVEMLNPSNLFDLNIGWAMAGRQFVRNGDAWVGITAKPVSVVTLKTFDPTRYGPLSFANPLPLDDPRNCQTVAADSSRTTENGLAWDIYTQVGALLRTGGGANPLSYGRRHGSPVERVYGFGYSQTGGYLYDYINGIHPLATRANGGRPVYDGYIVAVAGGAFVGAVPINQCQPAPPLTDPRRQFADVGVPIIHIMSQSDYLIGIAARRPDSDAFADRYRHYEMAGAGHATPDELTYGPSPADITAGGRAVPPMNCNEGPRSRFPSRIFFNAAVRNLDLWVEHGIAPPSADPILVENGAPVLDEFGNVQGGLRSPYVDVPTSTWKGSSTGASFCFIAGHEIPFDQARLDALYRNHGSYVVKVTLDVLRLVAGRFITVADGLDLIAEAARADVP
jgi:hypothetical protein